jgi:sugar phosphate isomerase/epimerase
MNNPILVSTIAFDGYDLDTTLAGMAAAGVARVELAYSEAYTAPVTEETFSRAAAAKVLASFRASGLTCFSLAAHTDMSRPDSVAKFKRRIDFAGYLDAGYVVSTAGPVANRAQFLENIRELGDYAAASGVIICLENMGDGRPNIIDSAAPAVELVREIALPSVRINYDFANLLPHLGERLRPEEDFRIALPETGYFHVKDAAKGADGNWFFPAIGQGAIDFDRIFPLLAADPRPIPLSLELSLRITRLPDATPIRAERDVPLATIERALRESLAFVSGYFPPGGKG